MSKKKQDVQQKDSDILGELAPGKEIRNDASEQEIINRVFRCGEEGNSYVRIFILTAVISLIYSPLFPKLTGYLSLDTSLLLPLRILSVLMVSFALFYDYKKR